MIKRKAHSPEWDQQIGIINSCQRIMWLLILTASIFILVFCNSIVYASKQDIDRANLELKMCQKFGVAKPLYIDGELHRVKNKKGQVRRVIARRATENV